MPARLTLMCVKEQTDNIAPGYECISDKYTNNYTSLHFKCDQGHDFIKTWGGFTMSYICPQCSKRYRRTQKDIEDFCKEYGYQILSNDYINTYSRIKVQCPNGHIYSTRADILLGKHWCRKCYYESISINNSGENHYNWQGGKTYEPYCISWTTEYKEYIKQRDNYKCLNPVCWSKNKNNIVVHHINYIKKDCRRKNLISLCNSCNASANYNREWHESWYSAIIYNRYYKRMEI